MTKEKAEKVSHENYPDLNSIGYHQEGFEWMQENIEYLRDNFVGQFVAIRRLEEDWEIVFVLSDIKVLMDVVERTNFNKEELVIGPIRPDVVMIPTPFRYMKKHE